MNKKEYVSAFGGVGPGAEAVERVLEMKNEPVKKKRYGVKAAVSLLAAVLLLFALALSANAATGGRLYQGVKLMAAGEKLDLLDFIWHHEEYVDENGNYMRRTTVESADGKNRSWSFELETPEGVNIIGFGIEVVTGTNPAESAEESPDAVSETAAP